MATSTDGYVLPPVSEAEACMHQLLGNMGGRVLLHHVLLVHPWPMAAWPLCEQSARLD